MEDIVEGADTQAQDLSLAAALGRQNGKSRLNALFLHAMFANMLAAKKQGKHHAARVLRAQARVGKRIAKRKGNR